MDKYIEFIKTIIEIILIIYIYISNKNKVFFLQDFVKMIKYTFILFCSLLLALSVFNNWILKEKPSIINIGFIDFAFVCVLSYVLGQFLKRKKHN